MNKMSDTALHFRVECAMCGDSLVAESDRLTVVVVAAQAHFIAHHGRSLSGREVLESRDFIWRIDEAIKKEKLFVRPIEGFSFRAILKEVTKESEEAANLPPLEPLLRH